MKKKTTFAIGTFHLHITWDEDGKRGVDQRGCVWLDIDNPHFEDSRYDDLYIDANLYLLTELDKLKKKLTEAETNLFLNSKLS